MAVTDSLLRTVLFIGLSPFMLSLSPQKIDIKGKRCQLVKIDYEDGAEYDPIDDTTLAKAKIRCGQLHPRSPCVKRFVKRGLPDDIRYSVTCGRRS